uniref:Uncharacterized protein n=1 Tax=Plectus sambesii TaxID=2011161 RepID=A0A914WK64_9BILA
MNVDEKTSAAGIPTYCCLGSIHLKSASFLLCVVYLLALARWWHATIPVAVHGVYPPVKVDDVVTIVALFVVVVWAMVGINFENELYLIPIVLVQLLGLMFTAFMAFIYCFSRTPLPPTTIILMELVLWLALLGGMFWAMTIFVACGFLFSTNYFTCIQQRHQLSPLKNCSPASTIVTSSPITPTFKYGLL